MKLLTSLEFMLSYVVNETTFYLSEKIAFHHDTHFNKIKMIIH